MRLYPLFLAVALFRPAYANGCYAPYRTSQEYSVRDLVSANVATIAWPDAAPLEGEEVVFSICCGRSQLHWANHHDSDNDCAPWIFWRTPPLKAKDMDGSVLSRNLPDEPHDHVFGASSDGAPGDAAAQSRRRAVPLISVYVLGADAGQEALLAAAWRTVPSRFFVMRGGCLRGRSRGGCGNMAADRLAGLTETAHLHGHPALMFDRGTTTRYTAMDRAGKILDGGIGPGIQSKLCALTKDTDALPVMTAEQVITRVNEAQDGGEPRPTFSRNTQEAMMVDVLQEAALKGRNVIEHWLDKAYRKSSAAAKVAANASDGRRVMCTGGDLGVLTV